jgi:metallo-beta-lactamase family protein
MNDEIKNKLQLTCWGGVGAVTGANFLLEDGQTRILVDCGLLQGVSGADEDNARIFPYDPKTINFLFLTHAHMDHIGKVPKLIRNGFNGIIFSTPETRELSELMFSDALKIARENLEANSLMVPLYDDNDVKKTMSLWQEIPYHEHRKISDNFSVFVKDAGHILGSAMYQFSHTDGSKTTEMVFTGDSGNSPAPLLKDTDKILGVDYILMDSVYGDRNHEPKEERDARFRQIITETIAAGGAVVMPAFSLERTQVILYELNNLIEENKIPSVPVFLDSPLGEKVTDIYKKYTKDFNDEVQSEIKGGDDIFNFPKLHITHGHLDSQKIIETPNPKIIIAGSGMSSGGRVIGHEITFLPDPKSTLLLMGYQAIGTLGRALQDKPKQIEIDGQNIQVRARIEMISGYSSHKDSDHLVKMVEDSAETVKKVFVVMGEPTSSTFLSQKLHNELNVDAICPERGKIYQL